MQNISTSKFLYRAHYALMCLPLLLLGACAVLEPAPSKEQMRAHWLQRAHEGDAQAQYQLAQTYVDNKQALKWYCRAAVQGYVPAQAALGDLFSDSSNSPKRGPGVDRVEVDFVSAYMWYTVAAAQGSDHAFSRRQRLGNMMSPNDVVTAKQNAARWKQQDCKQ